MVRSSEVTFENLACTQMENDHVTIWITKEVGPRIIGLAVEKDKNLMAVVADAKIPVVGC